MPSTSTSSERQTPAFAAQLFDGETAASHDVTLNLMAGGIEITDRAAAKVRLWTWPGLAAVDPPLAGQSLRLRHDSEAGTRLIVPAGAAADAVLKAVPHLARRFNPQRLGRQALIAAACIAALVVIGYLVLSFLPQTVADVMPTSIRQRLGDHIEHMVVKSYKVCDSPAGRAAIAVLDKRLSESLPDTPPFSVKVVALPVVNAFALPGGGIVVSASLIAEARRPAEVAGVLAHELGHVYYRHPEAQFVRVMGMQLLLRLATGNATGDTLGGLAGLLAILRYSRSAEDQADAFAARLMAQGHIDPMGLRDFFIRIQKKTGEGKSGGLLSGIGDMFSTHPGTSERIDKIKPLPPGEARPVMSPKAFADLKTICN